MRIQHIEEIKRQNSHRVTDLPENDSSIYAQASQKNVKLAHLKHDLKQIIALPVLKAWQSKLAKQLNCKIPFKYDLLCLGHRFGSEASFSVLNKLIGSRGLNDVLMVGCSDGGAEVDFWLRKNIKKLVGIDIHRYEQHWRDIEPQLKETYTCDVKFIQATVESMPLEDKSFDLIVSNAVLEHVMNLDLACQEMSRVLTADGLAWHQFGPLYFSHGGDHCISAYGQEHGFDHLFLEEKAYKNLINDSKFFETTSDPHQNYWAEIDLFSFLRTSEYIQILNKYFKIEHSILNISTESIHFRNNYPDKWSDLISNGVNEIDLLSTSMSIILRNRHTR
jgi:ubiquinone/menaquinone biosynthesis C-methylase UbiE